MIRCCFYFNLNRKHDKKFTDPEKCPADSQYEHFTTVLDETSHSNGYFFSKFLFITLSVRLQKLPNRLTLYLRICWKGDTKSHWWIIITVLIGGGSRYKNLHRTNGRFYDWLRRWNRQWNSTLIEITVLDEIFRLLIIKDNFLKIHEGLLIDNCLMKCVIKMLRHSRYAHNKTSAFERECFNLN